MNEPPTQSIARDARRRHSARMASIIPVALIAGFYTLVSISWWGGFASHLSDMLAGINLSHSILGAAHALSTALFFAILAIITCTRKQPVRRERRLKGWVLPVVVMAAMGVTGIGVPRDLPLPLAVVSTALVIGGTAFTLYALRFLGRHFGVVSDVRGLVTSGPYAWVRHPLYAGEAITLAGVVISVASPLTIAAFIVGQSLQAWRARTEEEALASVFPEYRDYAARTPMLIPGLRLHRAPAPASASGD